MSIRSVIVIFLAIVCGLSAALGLNLVLAQRRTAPAAPVETASVLVVRQEIPRGNLVAKEAVEIQAWPKNLVPQGALTKEENALERAALQTMLPGEAVFDAKLAARGAIGGMASIIPSGMRAYTIQTKTVASNVAGFLLPGNLVDVLLTFRGNLNDETGGGSTTVLLQAVEVLAVGKSIEPVGKTEAVDAQDVDSVTLLVTPDQVARLDLGQSLGILSLSLRNPHDKDEAETTPATIADIRFSGQKPVPKPSLAPLAALVASEPVEPPPPAPPPPEPQKPKQETVATSILTLRGQSWGEVRVIAPVTHEEEVEDGAPITP